MPPKRTRGTSHKKKKILVSTIKIENAAIVKKARLAKHPTRATVPSTKCVVIDNEDDANETTITITPSVAINSPPYNEDDANEATTTTTTTTTITPSVAINSPPSRRKKTQIATTR